MATTTISMLGVLGSALYLVAQKTQISLNLDLRLGHIIGLSMVGLLIYLGYHWNWYFRIQNYITNRRKDAQQKRSYQKKKPDTRISGGEGNERDFNQPEDITHSGEQNNYLKRLPAPAGNNIIYTPVNANQDIPLDVLPEILKSWQR